MISFKEAKKIYGSNKTIGQQIKEESDWLMEETWDANIQSKVCYIYDYFHDNKPWLAENITHENTTKTKVDAKFIITKYSSIEKDQVEYHLQFRPSQKVRFDESDELYYFETDYRNRYRCDPFIGKYIDIPDDTGTYNKWMIVAKEIANQFVKFSVLPCNYYLQWIEKNGHERIKRKMWCVLKSQNSYNSGIYTYYRTTKMENQEKCWLPLNSITEKIWYTFDDNQNMRVLVGALSKHVPAWIVSKVENANPLGLQKLTLYQSEFNPHTDYVNLETGEMFADYYDSEIEPTNPETSSSAPSSIYGKITASTSTIKVGGSYKTLTLKLYDSNNIEITDNYSGSDVEWNCSITDGDKTTVLTDTVTWLNGKEFNQKKIKFPDDRNYLGKVLDIKCVIGGIETVEQFELVI